MVLIPAAPARHRSYIRVSILGLLPPLDISRASAIPDICRINSEQHIKLPDLI